MPGNTVQELVDLIDEHLAEQLAHEEQARPSSSGTMFMDWDGFGSPKISYRNKRPPTNNDNVELAYREPESYTPRERIIAYRNQRHSTKNDNMELAYREPESYPPRESPRIPYRNQRGSTNNDNMELAYRDPESYPPRESPRIPYRNQRHSTKNDNMELIYREPELYPPLKIRRHRAGPEQKRERKQERKQGEYYVRGLDAESGFQYDYDGRIIHIHKESNRPSSNYSEYYALDAQQYDSNRPMLVVDKDLPALPQERKRRDKVVTFITKLFQKLSDFDILKQLKNDHKRKMSKPADRKRRPRADPRPHRRTAAPTPMPQIPESWITGKYT